MKCKAVSGDSCYFCKKKFKKGETVIYLDEEEILKCWSGIGCFNRMKKRMEANE